MTKALTYAGNNCDAGAIRKPAKQVRTCRGQLEALSEFEGWVAALGELTSAIVVEV